MKTKKIKIQTADSVLSFEVTPADPPARPNPKWVEQAIGRASGAKDTADNRPGLIELAQAIADLAQKNAILDYAKRCYGPLRPNSYAGKCLITGAAVEADVGFCFRDRDGRWKTLSWQGLCKTWKEAPEQ